MAAIGTEPTISLAGHFSWVGLVSRMDVWLDFLVTRTYRSISHLLDNRKVDWFPFLSLDLGVDSLNSFRKISQGLLEVGVWLTRSANHSIEHGRRLVG